MIKRAINLLLYPVRLFVYIRRKKQFGTISYHTHLIKPLRINGAANIYLEDNVVIASQAWLAAVPTGEGGKSRLLIKKGSRIGDFSHIYASSEIVIEKNVLIANFVYISDTDHGYKDITIPIHAQPIIVKGSVRIGEGSWLGEHVCVCGANIGKHCIIGANAVVTKDIPDYSIAVGIPARVIKYYNFEVKDWIKV